MRNSSMGRERMTGSDVSPEIHKHIEPLLLANRASPSRLAHERPGPAQDT
jgi:hypothetical protein